MIRLNFCNIANFGDAMNPVLIERLLGKKCIYANRYQADIIGVGSILTPLCRPRLSAKIKNLLLALPLCGAVVLLRKFLTKNGFAKIWLLPL